MLICFISISNFPPLTTSVVSDPLAELNIVLWDNDWQTQTDQLIGELTLPLAYLQKRPSIDERFVLHDQSGAASKTNDQFFFLFLLFPPIFS